MVVWSPFERTIEYSTAEQYNTVHMFQLSILHMYIYMGRPVCKKSGIKITIIICVRDCKFTMEEKALSN